MWKSTGKLADGREIIYFDESAGLHRAELPDRRDLSADATPAHGQGAAEAELRWDSVVGEWVVIAAQRQDRTFLPPTDECPLCPSTPGRLTEIPAPDYDVVVFENRFPSLHGVASGDSGPVARGAAGLAQPARVPRHHESARAPRHHEPHSGAARWSASPPTTTPRSPA